MQDDVADAALWLAREGIADPARIAIMGGSYGGYATLSGLVRHPELYACGVALCGPSNLFTFLNSSPAYWESARALMYERIGHPQSDEGLLRERSPLFHIERIRVPLLVAQGANDPRVKKAESLQIVEALRGRGHDVAYLEFADEGHGFVRPANRLRFYAEAERFLARHLGGRCEDP
jgi:dipeptidyl aminopeptidase/acylaminoacyl peptidase